MNKKTSFLIVLGAILISAPGASVYAYLIQTYGGGGYSVQSIVDGIIGKSWLIFAAIAVICFLVAGVLFLTASGEPEKIKTARSAFIWGVAGVIVGIISYSIITLVGSLI